MTKKVSLITRIAYCLALLGAVLPIGLANSGWVALATGGDYLTQIFPFVGPILFFVVGLYRIFVVIRFPRALDFPSASGFITFLRGAGVFLLYVGAICAILNWISGPLIQIFIHPRTESGVEFFIAGFILAVIGRIGIFGVLLFELGRLRSFEQQAIREV
jgi:hypothetical protein